MIELAEDYFSVEAYDKCILAHSDNDIKWEMCTNSCTAFSVIYLYFCYM